MYAEKRKLRSGSGVDEILNQVLPLGFQLEIFSAKRHDLGLVMVAGHFAQAVTVQPRAIDKKTCLVISTGCVDPPAICFLELSDFGGESDLSAPRANFADQGFGNRRKIDDAFLGDADSRASCCMWLKFANFFAPEKLYAR